jgi:hypothetical protein
MRLTSWLKSLRANQRRHAIRRPRRARSEAAPAVVAALESRQLLTTITVFPAADGVATDTDRNGTFDSVNTTSSSLTIRNFTFAIGEERAILEFDLTSLAGTTLLDDVTFSINVGSFTSPPNPEASVWLYAGDGTVTTADATVAATQATTFMVSSTGLQNITLSAAAVQPFLGGHLGLRVQNEQINDSWFSFSSVESSGTTFDPSLTLDYGLATAPSFATSLPAAAAGGEFLVNTFTTGNQQMRAPASRTVAMDAAGNYVITWVSNGQDGSGYGVYAQRYDATGAAVGGEFRVNQYTTGGQSEASVAMDAAGNFVVSWSSAQPGGNSLDIYARLYDAAGVALGSEFLVNSYTTGFQNDSSVAMDADGDFVVIWTSLFQDGSGDGIYAQRFDAAGVAQGAQFQVHTFTTGNQRWARLAMDEDGDFVVVWNSANQAGPGYDVYARRYDAAGVAQGGEFLVNTYTTGNQFFGNVAMDADGDFVVTWSTYGQGDGSEVFAQRYNAAGVAQGSEFRVNTYTVGNQGLSTVAMDADGDFVISWFSNNQDHSGYGVFAQQFNAAGTPLGREFRVNTYTVGRQSVPTIGMNGDGDFVIAWHSELQDGSGYGVYAQRYAASRFTNTVTTLVDTTSTASAIRVADFAIVDPDGLGTNVVSLTGPDAASFEIVGNELRLKAGVVLDAGVKSTYVVTVEVDDASVGGTPDDAATFTLTITEPDVTPPTVVVLADGDVITPGETLISGPTVLTAEFSEDMSVAGGAGGANSVTNPANWQLTRNGVDVSGLITGVTFDLNGFTLQYEAVLTLSAALTPGNYVLTASDALQDLAGNSLDGDGNSSAGGDFTRTFLVTGTLPANGEFRVNSYTTGSQRDAAVATDAAGNYIVVWNSNRQDLSGYGIYAQRYNANGVAQGSEFRVNTHTTLDQRQPAVAMDADGDFVIAWQSQNQDGSLEGIYAQRYDATGTPQGSEFRVNTFTANSQVNPAIAMDADGDFVVAWESDGQDGSGRGIYAQRYNASGVAQGIEFRVNTHTTSFQNNATVAMDADGDFVVAWQSSGQDFSNYGIYAQRYNAAGVAQGGEFRVNTYTSGSQLTPTVAMDDAGDFVIAWTSYNNQDGSGGGIFAQRYNFEGLAQGSEFRVNTHTTGNQIFPTLAMDGDGDFVVAWQSQNQDGGFEGVYAQRYSALGVAQGVEFRVNTHTTNSQTRPAAAMDADGDFVVAWQSLSQDGSNYGVYAQRYSITPLTNLVPSLSENASTAGAVRVADVRLVNGAAGTVTLSGPDAAVFEITGSSLFLKAGTVLDFETKSSYSVTVDVDYAALAGTPDAAAIFTLNIDDAGEVIITETGPGTSVSEHGSVAQKTDTFDVVLTFAPTTNVVLNITSNDTTEATVNVATLTFTPGNWNVAQTVTVSGVFDNVADGDQMVTITVSVNDALSDSAYHTVADQQVSVTVLDVANRPVVTGPTGTGHPALPTFSWNDVAGETSYALWLINKTTGALVFQRSDIAADSTMYTLTEADVPGGLANGEYRFWINSVSANGYSQSGPHTDFTVGATITPPATPTGMNADFTGNPVRPEISWNNIAGATYSIYLIRLADSAVIASASGLTNPDFTPGVDLASGRHRIWVKAHNAAGSSAWSAPYDFDVGTPIVPPTAPTGFSVLNANTANPTVTWESQGAGVTYSIWFINLDTGAVVSGATGLTTNSFTASGLTTNRYRIWVKAHNAAGSSSWSSPFDFDVAVA